MAHYTPELIAHVRHRYEETDDTLARIAADCGISERTVNRMRDREGWTRRTDRPPRGLPPATHLFQQATALLAARPPETLPPRSGGEGGARSAPGGGPAFPTTAPPTPDPSLAAVAARPPLAPFAGGGEFAEGGETEGAAAPATAPSAIERIERLVEKELSAEEAVRAQLGPLPRPSADAERAARTLATLTHTLHALARLRCGVAPERGLDDDDMPRDIDQFRRDLARRIREFVRSRTGGGVRGGSRPADGN